MHGKSTKRYTLYYLYACEEINRKANLILPSKQFNSKSKTKTYKLNEKESGENFVISRKSSIFARKLKCNYG